MLSFLRPQPNKQTEDILLLEKRGLDACNKQYAVFQSWLEDSSSIEPSTEFMKAIAQCLDDPEGSLYHHFAGALVLSKLYPDQCHSNRVNALIHALHQTEANIYTSTLFHLLNLAVDQKKELDEINTMAQTDLQSKNDNSFIKGICISKELDIDQQDMILAKLSKLVESSRSSSDLPLEEAFVALYCKSFEPTQDQIISTLLNFISSVNLSIAQKSIKILTSLLSCAEEAHKTILTTAILPRLENNDPEISKIAAQGLAKIYDAASDIEELSIYHALETALDRETHLSDKQAIAKALDSLPVALPENVKINVASLVETSPSQNLMSPTETIVTEFCQNMRDNLPASDNAIKKKIT